MCRDFLPPAFRGEGEHEVVGGKEPVCQGPWVKGQLKTVNFVLISLERILLC